MLHMTWDEGLAITARAWARNCEYIHNIHLSEVRRVHPVFSSMGENIWAGSHPSRFTVKLAIDPWVDEKKDYSYTPNTCTAVCGHYTQVVWASSYKVGCAVQVCPNGVKGTSFADQEGAIFVCNYATGGNVNGRQPYKRGTTCTGCEGECKGKLCYNSTQDKQQSYNWSPDWERAAVDCQQDSSRCLDFSALTPPAPPPPSASTTRQKAVRDWDPALSSCGASCLAVRPLALLCTFIAAYSIH